MTHQKTIGFTLIELVVVIVLLGLLSAIALPRFLDLSMDAKRAANQQLAATLTAALNNYKMKAQLPLSPSDPIQPTSTTFSVKALSMRAVDAQSEYPNNTGSLLFFVSKTKLIGGAIKVDRDPSTGQLQSEGVTTDATALPLPAGNNVGALSRSCLQIFNALQGQTVYAASASCATAPTIGGAAPEGGASITSKAPYQSFCAGATTGNVIGTTPSGFVRSTLFFGTIYPVLYTHYGSCLYVRTDTIQSIPVLYIYYDILQEVFVSVEADH